MQPPHVTCSKCRAIFPPEQFNLEQFAPCISCGYRNSVFVFPALFRAPTVTSAEQLILEGEASCFYHSQKKASVPCESCGRFLCALCDVELNGQHLCPSCLETGKKKGKLKSLENQRVRYDGVALAVAAWPMLLVWPSILGAPVALYISIRYWNSPGSILGSSKTRFVVAIILSALQIIGWISVIIFFATR